MASRLELHTKLIELLGSKNVYYQPPGNELMKYPAIRYKRKDIDTKYADNKHYAKMNCYELIVISRTPDHPVIERLLELPYCSYDRSYVSDNLNHDVLTLYY